MKVTKLPDLPQALIDATDRLFLGEAIFETIKVYNSEPCYAYLHWQRMNDAANALKIPFDLSPFEWIDKLTAYITENNIQTGGVKVILTSGLAPRGLASEAVDSTLFFKYFTHTPNQHPVMLISAPWQRDSQNPVYRYKSVNYLEAIQAQRAAIAQGGDDALFFNTQNHATEATTANLFIIQNNKLLTPSLACGVLPGITRARIIELCQQHGIDCEACSISIEDIIRADAVFVTSALHLIRPVKGLDGYSFKTTHILTATLHEYLVSELPCNQM